MTRTTALLSLTLLATACTASTMSPQDAAVLKTKPRVSPQTLAFSGEAHLANLRQLTTGLDARLARTNATGTEILIEATRGGLRCPQVYLMDADGRNLRLISPGRGAARSPVFSPSMPRHHFASTHADAVACPPDTPEGRAITPLWPGSDLYVRAAKGGALATQAQEPGFDGELAMSQDGQRLAFTSMRSGDPELWVAQGDAPPQQLTKALGYDGQASWSPDGKTLVYVRDHPTNPTEEAGYKELLKEGFVRSRFTNLGLLDVSTGKETPLLTGRMTAHSPVFHPDGERIVFVSNHDDPSNMDLYTIRKNGTHLERVTYHPGVDGSPTFTADGERLVFVSTRNAARAGQRQVFLADWLEPRPPVRKELRGQAELDPRTRDARTRSLSDAKLGGPTPGTLGAKRTMGYLEQHFAMIGLDKDGDTYGTPRTYTGLGSASLKIGKTTTTPGEVLPMMFSAPTQGVTGQTFVTRDGSLPTELEGKIVVSRQTEDFDAASAVNLAKKHGALGVVFVATPEVRAAKTPASGQLPVVRITPKRLKALFGEELSAWKKPREVTLAIASASQKTHDLRGTLAKNVEQGRGTLVVTAPWDLGGQALALASALEVVESLAATPGRTVDVELRSPSLTIPGAAQAPIGALVLELRAAKPGVTHIEVEGVDRARGLAVAARQAQVGLGVDVRLRPGERLRVTLPEGKEALGFAYEFVRRVVQRGVWMR